MADPHYQPITRKSFLRKVLLGVGGLVGLMMGAGVYGYNWERNVLQVERLSVTLPSLPKSFQGTKLVHFSDVHLGHYLEPQDLQKITDRIIAEQPDLICFTGDLVDESTRALSAAVPILSQLQAPLGKYAVLGNHDYRLSEQMVIRNALTASGFEVLDNRNVPLTKNDDQVYVAGVDDVLHGVPNIQQALTAIPEGKTVILLAHEPDFADEAVNYPVHLQLSGHSHGGQVRLPIIGHLMTPKLAHKYVQGMYQVGNHSMQVYTNRGIGTTILPVRLFCRPELTVLTLR
ncbi:metallophosphoesterase [Brevibacillus reuszeri]|uniref:Phosphoesterase n=1 Tax=Brevibacillus reuszeri TaxID=54915 RepID=A0A0K9YSL2_9BACL|nr:metallophosphoesterase [Brevibacillus reuszeri]KNB71180.1 phosphoesterase [Brevibacillus reuszeri]MED1857614.1 metallophosphoesterase [Brevibacillus reuszeri]GED66553.1 metallophosphoesterase [Brevibacillus reuszeri]